MSGSPGAYALAFLHVHVHGTRNAVLVAGALVGLDDDTAQALDHRTAVHRGVSLGDDHLPRRSDLCGLPSHALLTLSGTTALRFSFPAALKCLLKIG